MYFLYVSLFPIHYLQLPLSNTDLHFTEQSFYLYLFLHPSAPIYKTIQFFFNVEET